MPTWQIVRWSLLTPVQRKSVLRSKVFMKVKYTASGVFDKYKARLVAGSNCQDKELYNDLRSPTIATAHVVTIAALAAKERRKVKTIDVAGIHAIRD